MRSIDIKAVIATALAAMLGLGVTFGVLAHAGWTPRSEYLGFAGNLLGPVAGALIAFWLIVQQELRATNAKNRQLAAAVTLVRKAVTALANVDDQGQIIDGATAGVQRLMVAHRALRAVGQDYADVAVERIAAVEEILQKLDERNWETLAMVAFQIEAWPNLSARGAIPVGDIPSLKHLLSEFAPALQRFDDA